MMDRKKFLKSAGALAAGGSLIRNRFEPVELISSPVFPKALKTGDKIAFVAPAGIIFEKDDFARMERVMELKGYRVTFGENVRKRWGYFSGTDRERAEDVNRMFADPDVNAILAVRGGWGCSRILEYIDFDAIKNNPKIYCGFSDNTALEMAIYKKTGLVTFHGPNGNSEWTEFTRRHFSSVLKDGEKTNMQIPAAEKPDARTISSGKATGKLLGGNLTIIVSLLGTPYMPDLTGAILFTEDIGEQVYRIDRMLTQLKLAGVLDKISGFVFGQCYDCDEGSDPTFQLSEILDQHLKPLGIPAFSGTMISHLDNIFTVPQGTRAEMDADELTIRLLEPAVSL